MKPTAHSLFLNWKKGLNSLETSLDLVETINLVVFRIYTDPTGSVSTDYHHTGNLYRF